MSIVTRNATNQRYTKQLFYEMWIGMPQEQRVMKPPFTLYTSKEGYINFGMEYISYGDLSGYTISKKYFDSYAHWTMLLKCPWFKTAKEEWDKEIEARLYAEGMRRIRETAGEEGPQALQAARFLATKAYREKGPARGRPSKHEVQGALAQEVEEAKALEEDYLRIVKK